MLCSMVSLRGGRFAWLLTAVAFSTGLIELGTFKSFGVFLLPIRESLECSLTGLGTAMAASHTVCYVLAPLLNLMTFNYGPRRLVIAGGMIMFVSFLAVAFAEDLIQLSTFLIIWGTGVSLAYVPPVTAMMTYCHNCSLRYAVAATGCAFGMMIYPPLVNFLITLYGWRWGLMIVTAVNANICVLGALLRPPPSDYAALPPADSGRDEMAVYRDQRIGLIQYWWKKAVEIFYAMLPFDVLAKAPGFTIHCFAFFSVGITYSAWIIYLVPHAISRGIGSDLASTLSTAGGVGTLIGRILYGPVLHLEYITPIQMFVLLNILNFVAFMVDPLVSTNYICLMSLAVANGLGTGVMACMTLHVAEQVLDTSSLQRAWCLVTVFFAVGEVAGGALAGLIYDTTKSYEVAFVVLGGISAVTALILMIERLVNRCVK